MGPLQDKIYFIFNRVIFRIQYLILTLRNFHNKTFGIYIATYGTICDWASEKGPSGHIKFDHFFQLC